MLAEFEGRLQVDGTPADAKVSDYFEGWVDERKGTVATALDEETRLRKHVLPHLGHMRLTGPEAIQSRHIRAHVAHLKQSDLAPRTQLHVYNTLKMMFSRAVRDEVIDSNPCNLDKSELPKKVDKDISWRSGAVFERCEVEHLICDTHIPKHRRVLNALLFLTGARIGEIIALRWSDLHARQPLDMLLIARSYDTKRRRLGSTKTRTAREVPVHPTLAAMLIEWRDTGWRRMFGRDPNSADLIVPYPLTKGKGRRIGGPTTYWSSDTFRKRCYEDCERFRWRRRSPHDGRATFISLTQEDGCSPILERVTHAPQHTVRAGYTRPSWAALCREMAKYRISGTRVQNTDTDTPLTVSQVPAITDGKVGAGGNRTRVRKWIPRGHYVRSVVKFSRLPSAHAQTGDKPASVYLTLERRGATRGPAHFGHARRQHHGRGVGANGARRLYASSYAAMSIGSSAFKRPVPF